MDQHQRRTDQERKPLTPESVDRESGYEPPGWGAGAPFGDRQGIGGWLFGPRSFAGGRVQVYGCSPGCLLLSLIVSLLLSALLTLLLNAIF